jgi:hypothetical protein
MKILDVKISDDRYRIELLTDTGPITLEVDSDCCSSSWIETFDYESIIGGTVTAVVEKAMEFSPETPDLLPTKYPNFQQDYDRQYFYEIVTDKGSATIEMRNSSNGYYGGWLKGLDQLRKDQL